MSINETNIAEIKIRQANRRSPVANFFRRLIIEKPLGTFGGIIVLVLLLTGIFSDLLAPYSYIEANPSITLQPPSSEYLLGTDNLGRDLLSRVIYGARVSMIVGLSCSALSIFVAILIGLPSGFFGGKLDLIVQRFIDGWMCLPSLFVTLVVMTLVGAGMLQVIFVIGISHGIRTSRVIRSAVIGIKENVYVDASKAIGSSPMRILLRHILPNVTAPLIILFSLEVGSAILIEATISFLGFGIPPPTPTWGGMLSGTASQYMEQAPWMAIWPGLALTIAVYGINMLGDAVRDILDPKLKGGVGRYGTSKKLLASKKR